MNENLLWVEKYRPRKVQDCILPESTKQVFQQFVDDEYIPNLLLSGGPGVGKTTIARAMLEECDFDYIVINSSLDVNVDTLRNKLRDFASTVSFTGKRKYVILDEADYLHPQWSQPALRNFMEEFSSNCGFIMTCNFKNKIIEPLHSRCAVIDFVIGKAEKAEIAKQFLKRGEQILTNEGIGFEKKVLAELIMRHFPDWRRVINELQRYSRSGNIDTGILGNFSDTGFSTLVGMLKAKDFKKMRKWVGENNDIESSVLFRQLYDSCEQVLDAKSIPELVLILAEYSYKDAFVADKEINLVACLTTIMSECQFK